MLRIVAILLMSLCAIPLFSQKQTEKKEATKTSPEEKSVTSCGEPYCSESSRKLLPEHPYAPPKPNQVFRDPEFGSRMVRVTDETGVDGTLAGLSFISNSSAEIAEWGKFDPSLGRNGGYYFYVMTGGGGSVVFSMDAATMQVTPHCNSLRSCRLPSGGTFSYVDPHIIYGHFEGNSLISSYDAATGKESSIYDFKKCPNLPADLSGYPGAVANSGDDTKFSAYAGGKGQGGGSLVTYYDRTSGHCYWYDTGTGRLGGDMATKQISAGILAPPPAPALTATSGSLPAGDYYIQLTLTIHRPIGPGETLPSAEGHIHLDSTGGIQIAAPDVDNPYSLQVTGYNVYIGSAPGQEMMQGSVDQVKTGYPQSAALAKGSHPPTINTAGYYVHNARISRDGNAVKITPAGGVRSIFFWMPQSASVSACTTAGEGHEGVGSYCGGHTVLGYTHLINQAGPGKNVNLLYRSLSDLNHIDNLLPQEESMPLSMDTHWSWNNDNPSDTAPVCGAFSGADHLQGDGTRNPATNPLLSVKQAWDREVVCVATSGPPKVWRFAHHHATGACNTNARIDSCFGSLAIGNVSQDGKFYLFSSDWDWSLGSEPRSPGCPSSGRCRADVFIVELK